MSILPKLLVDTLRNVTDSNYVSLLISTPIEYFTNELLIKRYEVPNLLLDDESILRNVIGCDIYCEEGVRILAYRVVKKKQTSKSGRREVQICTVNKRERINSFLQVSLISFPGEPFFYFFLS